MSHNILDKAYAIEEANGVAAGRVVVQGSQPGRARLPEGPMADAILGVTTHSQSLPGANVAVRKAGIARVVAAGPIPVGAPVCVADDEGRVMRCNPGIGEATPCLGFAETSAADAGDIVEVFIALHQRSA